MLQNTAKGISIGRLMAAMTSAALLGACTPTPPAPESMARTTLQTAPADLQLLCANSAAGVAGPNAKVLPTASRQLPDGTFGVDLDAGGRKFSCVVDNNGTVRSVQPAQSG
ncbi:hypothetical protein B5K06_19285 [Rhizobium grahamii]|uniref:Lipoprotein n=2 Tax=Rhizobium grahamii TaxID=1120045 RepID=A0A370KKK1_9HYPH|nr:hypothetical protein [Rhizobium grahamii]RDJ08709.1 hypothetical protein B5K06_19285 [Rhizobium grahamii]